MKKLKKDIADRAFEPVYLIWGPEAYLRRQAKNALRKALTGEDELNYTYRGTAEDGGSSDKGTADMVFVEENGTLAVYAARLNIPDDPDAQNEVTKVTLFGTPTFKLGELTAENGIIQFMEAEVSKPLIRAEAT